MRSATRVHGKRPARGHRRRAAHVAGPRHQRSVARPGALAPGLGRV